jgi:adenine-specific DNA-methyltransferase
MLETKTRAELIALCKEKKIKGYSTKKKEELIMLLSSSQTDQNHNSNFRDISTELNKKLSKETRQSEGIFFTPKAARDLIFTTLHKLHKTPKTILEPSFGSGEFLLDCREHFPKATIVGCEKNDTLFDSFSSKHKKFVLEHGDFLQYKSKRKFDFIVGNPPYFVIEDKNPNCMTGRPNIYISFLYKCLTEHLKKGGFLAFVLPTSLFNCSYYEPMRKYISQNCTVHFVEELDVSYYQTGQDTMMLFLENTPDPTNKYLLYRNNSWYLTPYAEEIKTLCEGSQSLHELGFQVKTGDVVWNQEKPKLVNTVTDATPVLYSSNLVNGNIVLNNLQGEKKQYIQNFKRAPTKGPAILVNRGYGNNYRFEYGVVENDFSFYGENHVNMILPLNKQAEQCIPNIVKSFHDPRTLTFIQKFFGNGAISKTELEFVMPFFVA